MELKRRMTFEEMEQHMVENTTKIPSKTAVGRDVYKRQPYKPAFVRGKTLHVLGSYKLNDKQIETIQKLELLVIDEISMVRADLLDAVNDALCFYRNTKEPFGRCV